MSPFYASDSRHRNINVALEAPGAPLTDATATVHADRIAEIKDILINKLSQARETMQKYYNKHHLNIKFEEGDAVMLRHTNIRLKGRRKKLGYKKSGPYIINRKFGPTAYKLNLPQDLKIDLVSHINNLEK